MHPTFLEAFQVLIIGMVGVLVFLVAICAVILVIGRLLPHIAKPVLAVAPSPSPSPAGAAGAAELHAVLAAAVVAYESDVRPS